MANNYVQKGEVLSLTAPYNVSSGGGLLVGALVGIAQIDALQNAQVQVAIEGVWEVDKVDAQAWAEGEKVYWDDSAKNFTTTSSGNTLAGVAAEAAANPTATGKLRLNGGSF